MGDLVGSCPPDDGRRHTKLQLPLAALCSDPCHMPIWSKVAGEPSLSPKEGGAPAIFFLSSEHARF
jgi:hypothetical protein